MNDAVWSGILVYLEHSGGRVHTASAELLGEASRLAEISGEAIYGIAIGENLKRLEAELAGYPVNCVYMYEGTQPFQPDRYEWPVQDCIRGINPSVFLIGGTPEGRSLASRIAAEFGTGVTADCTSLELDEKGNLLQTRPAFGGNVMATIVTEHTRPQIATVRPGVFCAVRSPGGTAYKYCDWQSSESTMEVLERRIKESNPGIEDADLLIVGGRGIRKKEDLDMLWELADVLGGAVASSRALVERGWMPPERQIGLSGRTVAPKCMITIGVSGTVQFMAGMKQTENIIAVNEDPEAGIFDIAHYPICADLYEVIPELLKQTI